jgi:predicted kinase
VIIAMTGFSGTGKSVVARDIAHVLNAPVCSTDAIRREATANAGNRYAPEERLANYHHLIGRARDLLSDGSPVVLDGAFLRDEERVLAAELAHDAGVPLLFVDVAADPEVVNRRIQARSRGAPADHGSEATQDVLDAQRQAAAPNPPRWPDGTAAVSIDTSADAPASLDPLFRVLSERELIGSSL